MRDVFGIFVMATIAIGLAIAAWAHISERLEARARRKARGGDSHDPASCSHDWVVCESGTCIPDYSSVGANPQVTWHKYRCSYCGETYFECDSSCAVGECFHKGGAPI